MAVQGLFAGTKLEISDLQNLAPRAKNIADATGLKNEQLAILSMFKDVTTADVGATSFHTAIQRLVNPRAGTIKALGAMGLKPEDVDFQGESFSEVQQRLASGFEAAGPNAARLKGMMFGNEGMLAGNVLFSRGGVAQYAERLAMGGDASSFGRAAGVTEGGNVARANTAAAQSMLINASDQYIDPATARLNLLNQLDKQKADVWRRLAAQSAYDLEIKLGGTAETAVHSAMTFGGGNPQVERDILNKSRPDAVQVEVKLVDQNQTAIPHKSRVLGASKPNRTPVKGR